jgi:L-lactate dehydrogenase complex protein LldG
VDREQFLANVRMALTTAQVPSHDEIPPAPVAVPAVDLLDLFVERIAAVDGTPHVADSPADALDSIARIVTDAGARSFLAWSPEAMPIPGVLERLESDGLHRLAGLVPGDPAMRLAHHRSYLDVDAGITGAEAGLAESGSVVLTTGPGRPRMASLAPPLHVAIVRREDIHPSLTSWASSHGDLAADSANLVVVTGPSRTGDIEMHLNIGVHGPGAIHVVVV